ncbi:MAG: hypothetical protein HY005_00755 [Candidatus Staskawiczbacteria bacterium]|nr:hypothetical protein [Candidatus Staskawiczbacteria bacterium]MBI3337138.1 hypothetical protein [Candidatus Staskawiczbacteria bacterium]
MQKQKIILITIIFILVAGNIFFGVSYFFAQKDIKTTEQQLKNQQNNIKIINFTKLFIEKVLKAEKEVSFEDRLKLENAVRDLNDDEVLRQWEKFIESEAEIEAQNAVKDLLALLVKKIPIN